MGLAVRLSMPAYQRMIKLWVSVRATSWFWHITIMSLLNRKAASPTLLLWARETRL